MMGFKEYFLREQKKKKKKKETEGGASYSPTVPNKYQNVGSSSAGVMPI